MSQEPTPERTALYRLYDADDRLLYVGITSNPRVRWWTHARDKSWWGEVVRKEVEWFERRKSAEHVEKAEIEGGGPAYNRTFNADWQRELQKEDLRRSAVEVPVKAPGPDPLDIYYCFPQ